jgi:hypothetical protein
MNLVFLYNEVIPIVVLIGFAALLFSFLSFSLIADIFNSSRCSTYDGTSILKALQHNNDWTPL